MNPIHTCTKTSDGKHRWIERDGGNRSCDSCKVSQTPEVRKMHALETIADLLGEQSQAPKRTSTIPAAPHPEVTTETTEVLERVLAEDSARGLMRALDILSKVPESTFIRITGNSCIVGASPYWGKDLAGALRNAAAALQGVPTFKIGDSE